VSEWEGVREEHFAEVCAVVLDVVTVVVDEHSE
jgi:hypothetical protein